uniref:BTB domain-containing protein n=1 Tax=Panagrellus redivivus TaxID=6233 RepID=A0A7E4V3P1_PANRE
MASKLVKFSVDLSEAFVDDLDGNQRFFKYEDSFNNSDGLRTSFRMYKNRSDDSFRISLRVYGAVFNVSGIIRVGILEEYDVPPTTVTPLKERIVVDRVFVEETETISVKVKLEVVVDDALFDLGGPTAAELLADSTEDTTDVTIVVGNDRLKVHRGYLSMISPVFCAMFAHDCAEAKSGVVNITDFDFETVKNALEYCYGKNTGVKSTLEVVGMLRFADKYNIQTVIKRFEKALASKINNKNFCDVVHYAWELGRKKLISKCIDFFRQEHFNITLTPAFVRLPVAVREGIIQGAVSV